MQLPLPRGFFTPVQLSGDEQEQLHALERIMLHGYLERFDECIRRDRRVIDARTWKFQRQRQGVTAYTRQAAPASTAALSQTRLPSMLVVGRVDSTVQDMVYGAMWRTGDDRRLRTEHTNDGVSDGAVLHWLVNPTEAEPFRSVSVRWALLRRPAAAALVVNDRDVCYLSSTGIMRGRRGERIGFELCHSIQFPSCPPLESHMPVVRAECYACTFFRETSSGAVEIYHLGSFDAAGAVAGIVMSNRFLSSGLTVANLGDCSFAKKLLHAVRRAEEARSHADPLENIDNDDNNQEDERVCGICLVRHHKLRRKCAICRHWVCGSCGVRKELRRFSSCRIMARCFCKACLAQILRDDATLYAILDVKRAVTEQLAEARAVAARLRDNQLRALVPFASGSTAGSRRHASFLTSRWQRMLQANEEGALAEFFGVVNPRHSSSDVQHQQRRRQRQLAAAKDEQIVLRSDLQHTTWEETKALLQGDEPGDKLSIHVAPFAAAAGVRSQHRPLTPSLQFRSPRQLLMRTSTGDRPMADVLAELCEFARTTYALARSQSSSLRGSIATPPSQRDLAVPAFA